MRQRKRLSRSPHPRSVFSRARAPHVRDPDPASRNASRTSRSPRASIIQSKHRVRAAYVRIANQDVIVVEVKASLVADLFEAHLAISAIELTCGHPAVLWAYEPCGCRELFGRREHIRPIDEMSSEELDWNEVEIDFARPVLPRRAPAN